MDPEYPLLTPPHAAAVYKHWRGLLTPEGQLLAEAKSTIRRPTSFDVYSDFIDRFNHNAAHLWLYRPEVLKTAWALVANSKMSIDDALEAAIHILTK